jgi:hypothetical protein
MLIPATIKIGRQPYTVHEPQFSPMKGTYGAINYTMATLHIAKCCPHVGTLRSPRQRSETFWHEVVHGVLFDMNSPLWNDETFVTQFARTLSNAINSARFE